MTHKSDLKAVFRIFCSSPLEIRAQSNRFINLTFAKYLLTSEDVSGHKTFLLMKKIDSHSLVIETNLHQRFRFYLISALLFASLKCLCILRTEWIRLLNDF